MIYICIPAFNEARTVGILLWKIRRVMSEISRDYEILVLDDGSTDGTAEVLAPYTRVLSLTVFRNATTQGYAAALDRLVREAVARSSHPRRDAVVVLQADFTEAPGDLPLLIRRLEEGADVVATTPANPGEGLPRALRWSRKGLLWLLRRATLPAEVRDPFTGFRAYRAVVLKRALAEQNGTPLLSGRGWAANAELLLAVAPHARRIEQAEVVARPDLRQRETRFRPWDTVVDVWNLSRRVRRTPQRLAPSHEAAD